jgi:hypothetical protein
MVEAMTLAGTTGFASKKLAAAESHDTLAALI